MSMTGSLMGYENNNEVNQAKCKKPLKTLPVVSSVNASGVTTIPAVTSKSRKSSRISRKQESCHRGHVNSLWSVWYGILAVSLQAYVATRCARRFVGKKSTFSHKSVNIFFVIIFLRDRLINYYIFLQMLIKFISKLSFYFDRLSL